MRNADPDAADENSAVEAKELLNSLKDSMEQYGGTHSDTQIHPAAFVCCSH